MANNENLKPFKKGDDPRRNSTGKNKGSTLSFKTIINRWLSEETEELNPISNKTELMTQSDVITLKQIAKARKGDTRAFEVLKDHIEAKPKQVLEVEQNITFHEEKTYVKNAADTKANSGH